MNSSSVFNAVLKDFLSELRATFPQNESLHMVKKKIKNLTKISPGTACAIFKEKMKPYQTLIETRDQEFIYGAASETLKKGLGVDIKEVWEMSDDATKECIWNYISTLFRVADSSVEIPKDALKDIQDIAKDLSSKIPREQLEGGDLKSTMESILTNIDPTAIHSIVKQFDPSIADEMMQGFESGELLKGVQDFMENMDPKMIESLSGMFQGGGGMESMDMSQLMGSMAPMLANMDPNMLKMLGGK